MKFTPKRVRWLARQFRQLTDINSLARLLGMQPHLLQLLATQPFYNTFRVPKKNGTFRLIEDPEPHLKQVQKRLNTYLQCVYYLHRTRAAYGFQISVEGDADTRNILTNARRHVGKDWLLNADFKDFFHQITFERVVRVFNQDVFQFEPALTELLARLTTYTGRLAMGAPTSPVLSNLAAIAFDGAAEELANLKNWTYTRFADDLTFSATDYISPTDVQEVRHLATAYGLVFNNAKVAVQPPGTPKTVTGLVITKNDVELSPAFVDETIAEMGKLGHLLEIHYRSGRPVTPWLEQYRKQIEGQLTFAGFVLDETDAQWVRLSGTFNRTLKTLDPFEPVSWINAAYFESASHSLY